MSRPFRLIDTGLRDGREQIAFDQAMIDLHKAGEIPDTMRFLQFHPTALIGRHQDLSKELRLDFCQANGIRTVRRITGGGALYFDEKQLGWELVFHRATLGIGDLGTLAAEICGAAAHGISKLGVEARHRPPNDIEVGGQKVSGTGGFFDGSTLFYQGTILADMDPATMFKVLNLPAPQPGPDGKMPAPRVTTLAALLGAAPPVEELKQALVDGFAERLGLSLRPGPITEGEEKLARQYNNEEIGTDSFVAEIDDPEGKAGVLSATLPTKGGTIAAHVRLEGPSDARIREVLITGDFFVTPPRVVLDLEAALRGTDAGDVQATIASFFARTETGVMTVRPEDFGEAVAAAVALG